VRKHGTFDIIINWGSSERRFPNARYINDPECVVHSSDKVATARIFAQTGVPSPEATTDMEAARAWLGGGDTIVERHLRRGHAGRGVRIVSPDSGLALRPSALFTKYVKKADEYRVHVFNGQVIDVSQKKKRREVDNDRVNYQVRNAGNGWVYCREGVFAPDCVRDAATLAVRSLGLDFGAVDVGYNLKKDEPCVYEVNSAPGLEGTTLTRYLNSFYYYLPAIQGGRYKLRRQR
jgi:glutathione synthase/RimK-type ligase-like ATP-grasp enzyme